MFEETSGKHDIEILSESRICQHIRKTVYCAEFRGEMLGKPRILLEFPLKLKYKVKILNLHFEKNFL